MAHQAQRDFILHVRDLYPHFFTAGNHVLDCGSLDINGNNREFFSPGVGYTGIDLGEGKNVDFVSSVEDWHSQWADDPTAAPWDVVISTEMLEHNPTWKKDVFRMYEMVRAGGLLIITAGGVGRQEHGTSRTTPQDSPFTCSSDYYHNISNAEFLAVAKELDFSTMFLRQKDRDFQFYGI